MPIAWLPIPALVLVLLVLLRVETRPQRNLRAARLLRLLATLLVLSVAALSFAQPIHLALYSSLIVIALLWSLIGDWLLSDARDALRFGRGAMAFVVAHGFYIAALSYVQVARGAPLNLNREGMLAAAIGLLALVVYVYLRPRLGESHGVVAIYITVLSLMVHRAVVVIASARGTRTLALEDFFLGPGKTVLQPDELVVSFKLPPPPPGFGAAYLRFTPRNEMDIAVVGVGAAITVREGQIVDARIALGAVAPTPLLAREAAEVLIGKAPSPEAFEEAARAAQALARPITDVRGTAEQRRHLVGVLTRRALMQAAQRTTLYA